MKRKANRIIGALMAFIMVAALFPTQAYSDVAYAETADVADETVDVTDDIVSDEADDVSADSDAVADVDKDGAPDVSEEPADDTTADTVSADDATADSISADSVSSDDAEPIGDGLFLDFTELMYGEDGSNEKGNLDAIFRPAYMKDGNKIEDIETGYLFLKGDAELPENPDKEWFDSLKGEVLQELDAGTVVTAVVRASAEGVDDAYAVKTFTIAKRRISLLIESYDEVVLEEKTAPEDDIYTISGNLLDEIKVLAEAEGDDTESVMDIPELADLTLSDITDEDVTLDISDIDYEEIGYTESPADVVISEDFSQNYEVSIINAGAYVKKSVYQIKFVAFNEGEKKEFSKELNLSAEVKLYDYLRSSGLYDSIMPDMSGFVDASENDAIIGWLLYRDNAPIQSLDTDFTDGDNDFMLQPKTDYYLVAEIKKTLAEGIFIDAIPSVCYNGKSHLLQGTPIKLSQANKKCSDINLTVYRNDPEKGAVMLNPGTDYKVTYKNNVNASMVTDGQGELVSKELPDSKRPQLIITGAGNFKGFSAKAYYEIVPMDLKEEAYSLVISGVANSYKLNTNGKLATKLAPTVKYNKIPLKQGRDYEPAVYKYDDVKNCWEFYTNDPAKDTLTEGRYLYLVKGMGNYCGEALCGNPYFNDGTSGEINPSVCEYNGAAIDDAQFMVVDNVSKDLSKAKVTVGVTKKPYKSYTKYNANDFKISVIAGGRKLTEGVDYKVQFDGNDFKYIYSRTKVGSGYTYSFAKSLAIFDDEIFMANKYKVWIEAITDNPNGYYGLTSAKKQVAIKGITINPKWFILSSKAMKYNGTESGAGRFGYDRRCQVNPVGGEIIGYDSEGNSQYFSNVYSGINSKAVVVFSDYYDRVAGTYYHTILPVGAGVDHSKTPTAKFKRSGITMKEALKKGYIKVTADPTSEYNAGGALPTSLKIYYNGRWSTIGQMRYSTGRYILYDGCTTHNYPLMFTVTVKNNKAAGKNATIQIKGDGKTFKGAAAATTFYVNPREITGKQIKVIDYNDHMYVNGVKSGYLNSLVYEQGGLYAKITPVKKPASGSPAGNIELYQTYFANATDASNYRLSLAKLSKKQYSLQYTKKDDSDSLYSVKVMDYAGKGAVKGFIFDNVSVGDKGTPDYCYPVYDGSARITSVNVTINGQVYEFPKDSNEYVPYKGTQIKLDSLNSITLSDGTVLSAKDAKVTYGKNLAAGKKAGSFTVTLNYNEDEDSFLYYGSRTFTFNIDPAPLRTV